MVYKEELGQALVPTTSTFPSYYSTNAIYTL